MYFSRTPGETQLPAAGPKPHNRPVAETVWQRRIRRAENLAAQHPFAGQILTFYIQTARFQRDLYQRVEVALASRDRFSPADPGLPELLASFPVFLTLVEEKAPARLAGVAHELRNLPPDSRTDMFNQCWTNADVPADPAEFIALAFLQPYAEFIRSLAPLKLEGYTHSLCPFCGRKPGLGVLRQMGDGARRNLLCGFCLCEWEFRRIVCPGCDEKDHAKLPVYTADQFPYIRVECCDTCRTYLKSIDLTKDGLADPLVDELASVPLDLWAQERGYTKLHPNLLGM
ncbi:MAG: formate dehydrogenase accessory protein FdhE [Candidatus Sulfotelmatobacter sp.]